MTDKLPHQLLALFAPRPPLRWVPPVDHAPEERRTAPMSGLAQFLPALKEYKDNDGYVPTESWLQRRDRKAAEHKAEVEKKLVEGPKDFKPSEDPNIRGDAFKTLIVARLSYEANEQDLEREFSRYGPVERIRIVKDTHADEKGNKKRKPHRGYAFVVFEREKDMRGALEACDGIRIKDRRIKVDVERGRTMKEWKPRRLGGGLGGRGYTKAAAGPPMGGRGGGGFPGRDGGGFRGGGFRGGGGGFGGGRDRDRNGGGFRGGDRGGRGFDRDRGFGSARGGDRAFGDGPPGGGRSERRGFGANGAGYDSRDDRPGGGYRERDYDRGGDRDRDRDRDHGRDRDRGDRDRDRRGGGDRDRDGGRRTGSNMEPVRPRERERERDRGDRGDRGDRDRDRGDRDRGDRDRESGGYRDHGSSRDYDRQPRGDDDSRKRGFDGPPHEETRKLRRYQ
ncbi:hypothetical protein Sste5346_002493 [Sporothrix stenoceras]|uniref:RRM domain-containing protein n=1 Tax=Sporothrix stenoceras TaxID=5173 RepID=A0ABR3ZHI4_9PEZI